MAQVIFSEAGPDGGVHAPSASPQAKALLMRPEGRASLLGREPENPGQGPPFCPPPFADGTWPGNANPPPFGDLCPTAVVPEPSTIMLLTLGLLVTVISIGFYRGKVNRRKDD